MQIAGEQTSVVSASGITPHTRKRLWGRSGNRCAFPGCEQRLVEPARDIAEDTVVGEECHIIARRDSPRVARSVSLLTAQEKELYAALIADRNGFENYVLMCRVHSAVIDDIAQSYSVADVIEMKRTHEQAVESELTSPSVPMNSSEASDTGSGRAAAFRLLVLEDVPAWERKAVARLARSDPSALQWLQSEVGEPADPDMVAALIRRWPKQLAQGSFDLVHTVVRQAERGARWSEAADVWERLAHRAEGALRADHLVCAAVDAKVGGEPERYATLLDEAETIDPTAPRLQLVRLDEVELDRRASEQLQALEELDTEDPALASMISVQRARAAMLIPDLELAETHLQRASDLDAESIVVASMRINLHIQRARIALHEDRDFSLAETMKAKEDALALRHDLMSMGRWEESARVLMLAGDVPALLRDFPGAREIIMQATPEELAAGDGAIVLGEAALRVAATDLALTLTANAERNDAIRRIRAAATIDLLNAPDATSLQELRTIALGGGRESENAAIARLVACLPPVAAPWDEDVAQVVKGVGAERFVPSLRIYNLAATGHPDQAQTLAAELPDTMWAAELQLRVIGPSGAPAALVAAAEKFLRFGPDASGRLLAATALDKADQAERAGELLVTIAHETNASPITRSNAFATLLQSLCKRELWGLARTEFTAWKQLARDLPRPDQRISEWEVRIARHPK
jgi:hypothetical protein